MLVCNIVVSKFKHQSCYRYVPFWIWERYESPDTCLSYDHCCSSIRMVLALNNSKRLICHQTKKPNRTFLSQVWCFPHCLLQCFHPLILEIFWVVVSGFSDPTWQPHGSTYCLNVLMCQTQWNFFFQYSVIPNITRLPNHLSLDVLVQYSQYGSFYSPFVLIYFLVEMSFLSAYKFGDEFYMYVLIDLMVQIKL